MPRSQLAGGAIAHINSSWCTRVRRDDLVTFHVDGTLWLGGGRPAAEMLDQARVNTPRPVWNPDVPQPIKFFETWAEVPDSANYDNGFKMEWEMFIRHLYDGTPFKWTLVEGAKGVQTGRGRAQELEGAALDRYPAAEGVTRMSRTRCSAGGAVRR